MEELLLSMIIVRGLIAVVSMIALLCGVFFGYCIGKKRGGH